MQAALRFVGLTAIRAFAVVGVIAICAVGYFTGTSHGAHGQKGRQGYDMHQLERALTLYEANYGSFPSTEQGLGALIGKPGVGGPPVGFPPKGFLLSESLLFDVWGNPVHYESPGIHKSSYDLASWGADGQPGGTGVNADISNW